MLKFMLFSAIAPGRSSRGTISPTEDCQAGPLSAEPQPIRKVKTRSSQGVISPSQVAIASAVEVASMNPCAISMTLRRSKLSDSAPAVSENSITGSVLEACTSATMFADGEIEAIIHEAPTDWISPPKFEARLENQTSRKIAWRMGASEEACTSTVGSIAGVAVSASV